MIHSLTTLDDLILHAADAEIVTWQGQQALKLVDGLAILKDTSFFEGRIEVTIGTEGAAYPGIAFRIKDRANYELAYAQPHTSGQWDAIQYDPIFHGSNTWQIYHGPAYQHETVVPTGQWFTLRADVKGDRVALSIDGQAPLIVPRLMHAPDEGAIGVWTYLPAYFRDLRVTECPALPEPAESPTMPAGAIDAWFVEGFGRVDCEANGILNLNRCLPVSMETVTLSRQFELTSSEDITLSFGFSDQITLQLDGEKLFEGEHIFAPLGTYESRGYIRPDQQTVSRSLEPGMHTLTADLTVTEPVGWGLSVLLKGQHVELLPID